MVTSHHYGRRRASAGLVGGLKLFCWLWIDRLYLWKWWFAGWGWSGGFGAVVSRPLDGRDVEASLLFCLPRPKGRARLCRPFGAQKAVVGLLPRVPFPLVIAPMAT